MKKNKSIGILLSASILFGCAGSVTVETGKKKIDENIYGLWRTTFNLNSKRGVITFKPNGEFEDSLIDLAPVTFDYIPKLVTVGKFTTENEIIRFNDVKIKYLNLAEIDSADSFIKYSDILSWYLAGNKLVVQPIIELQSERQFNRELSGRWGTKRWVCYYNKNSDSKFSSGYVEETYDFNPEKKIVKISKRYLFDNSPVDSDTTLSYSINDREIKIGNDLKKWIVYHNNKMYWFNRNYYSFKKLE